MTESALLPDAAGGLRERKKQQTRQALHEAAVRLIGERGWHETTIAGISAAANVSPRTFFSYYASKEAALFGPVDTFFAALDQALRDRPHGGDALDELWWWISHEAIGREPFDRHCKALVHELADEVDAVTAYGLRMLARVQEALARELRLDLRTQPDDPLPTMAAAAAINAIAAVFSPDDHRDHATAQAAVQLALTFVRGGLEAVRPEAARR